jgi:hypothetical protein
VTAQIIAGFWATATRSPTQNGLGLAVAVAAAALDHIERVFSRCCLTTRRSMAIGSTW